MPKLSPVFNDAQLDNNQIPMVGGRLFTWNVGSTSKATTHKDAGGVSQHTNPIILNARGEPPAPIYLSDGVTYRMGLAPANDFSDPPQSLIRDIDTITGVNDPQSALFSEWVPSGLTPTFVSTTSFTVPGDQTTNLHPGRRIRTSDTGGADFGEIIESVFGSLTTVTVLLDSGVLDSGLSILSISISSASNTSVPFLFRIGSGLLRVISTTLIRFNPYQGNRVMVKKGSTWNARVIPSAGISAANTSVFVNGVSGQNLASDTEYLVTLFDNSGVLTIDFRTTITHLPDVDTGVEIATGQPTRTVIGVLRTTGTVFGVDTTSTKITRSWYNDSGVALQGPLIIGATTTSTTPVSIPGGVTAVLWGNEAGIAHVSGRMSNSGAGNISLAQVGIDGAVANSGLSAFTSVNGGNQGAISGIEAFSTLSEGRHFFELFGNVTAGTATYDTCRISLHTSGH